MITVLDITGVPPARDGNAEVVRFLNHETVGAHSVEGIAYRLEPNGSAGSFVEAAAYQLFYVTAGKPVALYGGKRHVLRSGCGVYCDPGESCAFENSAGETAAFYRFVIPA